MRTVRLLALFSATLSAGLALAQAKPPNVKPAFFVTLGPSDQNIQLGSKVTVKAAVVSTTDILDMSLRSVTVGCAGIDLVHVELQSGNEPEKTEWYRHLLGDFRPGDGPNHSSGSCFSRDLGAGGALPITYDLSAFYRFTATGKYTVWVEINDAERDPSDGSVRIYPIRSNTAHFNLVSAK